MDFNTRLLHGRAVGGYADDSTLPHISQAVEYRFDTAEEAGRAFSHRSPAFAYSRVANPTVSAFERRMAEMEGGAGAYACASGMTAVTLSLLNILSAGDEIISARGIYGGTMDLFSDLEDLGIHTVYADDLLPQTIEPLFTDRTRVVFGEVIGNPSLRIMDIAAAAAVAHRHHAVLVVDATTATPRIVTPLKFGADIVVHSTTKYISGSGQAVGGVIVDSGRTPWKAEDFPALKKFTRFGSMAYLIRLRTDTGENFGGTMSPVNAYLTTLGLETLGVRMDRICSGADALAGTLASLPSIEVNYPTLPGHPDEALVESELSGRGGGIVTIRAGSRDRAFAILNHLKCAMIATSLGDVRTLAIHPASTFNINATPEQNEAAGVFPDTIRVSVGIEDAADLIEDFTQAVSVC